MVLAGMHNRKIKKAVSFVSGRHLFCGLILAVASLCSCGKPPTEPGSSPAAPASLARNQGPKPVGAPSTPASPPAKRKPPQNPAQTGWQLNPQSPIPLPPARPGVHFARNDLPESYYEAAIWAEVPYSRAWTETVIHSVRRFRLALDKARDIGDFCPAYEKMPKHRREICWLRLISGVAELESDFEPDKAFQEPRGKMSIGLLQVSNGECIVDGNRNPNLEDPISNLKCGIAIMAKLINEYGRIDGPLWGQGAAAYWSTLRTPYKLFGLHLGKKSEVINFTKNYNAY